ncbi:MAG: UDP-N-acetylmuramate--L-alanine ligase [Chitinophagaceae bacterium]|nr:UDP-N-acetylmuramate--L-alanine ligase [Chitinophagaceae bacterium]
MIRLDNIQRIYFIGIGGIGMSALARYFSSQGKMVSGYDRTETALTRQLTGEGIEVMYEDNVNTAPADTQLVIYTPAIPDDHKQFNYYRDNNYPLAKRSEVLGAITESSFNICVAGTHGKTTISTMIAHILRDSGYGCNAFLGGIATNYNSNFWSNERNTCVIEADEYDRSFLKLSPDIAVITAMDADHLDIYGTESAMQDAFVEFAGKIKSGGTLVVKKGLARDKEFEMGNILRYGINDSSADVYAHNVKMMNGYYLFDVTVSNAPVEDVALNMGGLHNVENASVAIAIAKKLGIGDEAIKNAVEDFKGVKRRFEYIVKKKNLVYVDDYAHHPEELSALISSARNLFSGLKCTVIFQPHLFTRTRDLADQFAKSLDLADEVLLLPIYPARELPISGVTSEIIKNKLGTKARILSKEELLDEFRRAAIPSMEEGAAKSLMKGLLITAGAGDIDTLVQPIKKILSAS